MQTSLSHKEKNLRTCVPVNSTDVEDQNHAAELCARQQRASHWHQPLVQSGREAPHLRGTSQDHGLRVATPRPRVGHRPLLPLRHVGQAPRQIPRGL